MLYTAYDIVYSIIILYPSSMLRLKTSTRPGSSHPHSCWRRTSTRMPSKCQVCLCVFDGSSGSRRWLRTVSTSEGYGHLSSGALSGSIKPWRALHVCKLSLLASCFLYVLNLSTPLKRSTPVTAAVLFCSLPRPARPRVPKGGVAMQANFLSLSWGKVQEQLSGSASKLP